MYQNELRTPLFFFYSFRVSLLKIKITKICFLGPTILINLWNKSEKGAWILLLVPGVLLKILLNFSGKVNYWESTDSTRSCSMFATIIVSNNFWIWKFRASRNTVVCASYASTPRISGCGALDYWLETLLHTSQCPVLVTTSGFVVTAFRCHVCVRNPKFIWSINTISRYQVFIGFRQQFYLKYYYHFSIPGFHWFWRTVMDRKWMLYVEFEEIVTYCIVLA